MRQVKVDRGSLLAPFVLMLQGGVPCGTLIDVGCADGTYSLEFLNLVGPDGAVCNLDANSIYEPSLARIRSELGGHYRICAVSSFNGRVNFSAGRHEYWTVVGGEAVEGAMVECRTLDSLCEELKLRGPYFIKMDIEGAELAALLGADRVLAETAGLVLETNIYYGPNTGAKLTDISAFLSARGFSLFDLVNLVHRRSDQILYQAYAAFLNTRYEFRGRSHFADGSPPALTEQVMQERRRSLLATNEQLIAHLLALKR